MATATKKNPALWKRIVARIKAGTKGGRAGQWSARKAQLAVSAYKKAGGSYAGSKKETDLSKWTKQKWRTKSGKPSLKTGERYLPEKAIKNLSAAEYAATSKAKREGMKKGEQFVSQPKSVKEKTKKYRT
jgi:hypothetical protein